MTALDGLLRAGTILLWIIIGAIGLALAVTLLNLLLCGVLHLACAVKQRSRERRRKKLKTRRSSARRNCSEKSILRNLAFTRIDLSCTA